MLLGILLGSLYVDQYLQNSNESDYEEAIEVQINLGDAGDIQSFRDNAQTERNTKQEPKCYKSKKAED